MNEERTSTITVGGNEYTLLLTTRATKEIAGRYGGLENLGEKLMKTENFEMAIEEIVWLITLLANQSIQIHNLKDKEIRRHCSPRKRSNCSPVRLTSLNTKPPSWRLCIKAQSAMWKASMTQKTRKSGDRCGIVHPAFLLRRCTATSLAGGVLANAIRISARSVGMPQAV